MSQTPFSKPDVNDIVSSSPAFKIRSSLNYWSGGRLPKARVKHSFGLIVIALLLLGLQLTACGNNPSSPNSSVSPTSNATSLAISPTSTTSSDIGSTSASTTTTGPTTRPTSGPTTGPTTRPTSGPTTGPTVVPTADPSSFTITIQQFTPDAMAGQATVQQQGIDLMNKDNNGILNWTVSVSMAQGAGWLSFSPSSGTLQPGQTLPYDITVTVSKDMPAGTYNGTVQFSPNGANNVVQVSLTVSSALSVSVINPKSGSTAGGTSVTITGTGFTGATGVSFGGTVASGFTVNSDTQITATSPIGSGTVNVTVTTPNGTASAQFTYT